MKTRIMSWALTFTSLLLIVSCKPSLNSDFAETGSGPSTVTEAEINDVSTGDILALIRTTGDTYQNENFKTIRHCANCIAQRRIDEVATQMVEQQLRFLQGVFVDGLWGDVKMVAWDAPQLAYKAAVGAYELQKRFNSFILSYGSMVSEFYTGHDYVGYGSETARDTIDKSVNTLMSATNYIEETLKYSREQAEVIAKQLYMLYKNPSVLKNAIYDMVRLLGSGLTTGHNFARSVSCATILQFFNNWIPRLMGMVSYEVLIEVVLGFVTAATAGAASVLVGAKIGLLIGKLARVAKRMPYIDEIIAGFKRLAEMVIRLVKRGEDTIDAGRIAENATDAGRIAENAEDAASAGRVADNIKNPCKILSLTGNDFCELARLSPSERKSMRRQYQNRGDAYAAAVRESGGHFGEMKRIEPKYSTTPNGDINVGHSTLDDLRNPNQTIEAREYWFENPDGQIIVIQEHSIGHQSAGFVEDSAHFNVRAWDSETLGNINNYTPAQIQDVLRNAAPPRNLPAIGHYDF